MSDKLPVEEALKNKMEHLPVPDESSAWVAMSKLLDENKKPKLFAGRKTLLLLLLVLCCLLFGILFQQHFGLRGPDEKTALSKTNPGEGKNAPRVHTSLPGTENKTSSFVQNIHERSNLHTGDTNNSKITAVNKNSPVANMEYPEQPGKPELHKEMPVLSNVHESSSAKTKAKEKRNPPGMRQSGSTKVHNKPSQFFQPDPGETAASNQGEIKDAEGEAKSAYEAPLAKTSDGSTGNNSNTDAARKGRKTTLSGKEKMQIVASLAAEDQLPVNENGSLKLRTELSIHKKGRAPLSFDHYVVSLPQALSKFLPDSSAARDSLGSNNSVQPEESRQNRGSSLVWSTGLSLKQQIPIGRQKWVEYNAKGKSNFVADYLPGVYVRVERPSKWAAQGSFTYGSPRMIESIAYSRKTSIDPFSHDLSVVSLHLKKVYYHESSLSFNYYVKPRWSIGGGIINNQLHRSISDQRTAIRNTLTLEETSITKVSPRAYNDSFLYKSTTSLMLQLNFEWRSLNLSLRYASDLQPYIKYTLPSGEMKEARGRQLTLWLFYRIWGTKLSHHKYSRITQTGASVR